MGQEQDFPHGLVTIHEEFEVQILLIDNLHILADGKDKEHRERTGFPVDEVLVLSKHASASEVPALTLHAIGVPGETPTVRGPVLEESRVKQSPHQQDSGICLGQ
ncbi:MAG: hypothetical protein Ct9H90mP24_7200 [Methanobacteriota archaeon]|nr:MAG: hypothetical protein Ct9H90mP24_7200 [Euryarchaeota archaeon]